MTARDVPSSQATKRLDAAAAPASPGAEHLLDHAEAALAALKEPSGGPVGAARRFEFQDFAAVSASHDLTALAPTGDADLDVRIELGRSHIGVEELAELRTGSVVPLDKLVGDPADIFVDGRLVARGEVVVLDDNFCVRVTELLSDGAIARNG
jgi:flagellar motor switch protein FliN/FliY